MPDRVRKSAEWTFRTFRFGLLEETNKGMKITEHISVEVSSSDCKVDGKHNGIEISCIYFMWGAEVHKSRAWEKIKQ